MWDEYILADSWWRLMEEWTILGYPQSNSSSASDQPITHQASIFHHISGSFFTLTILKNTAWAIYACIRSITFRVRILASNFGSWPEFAGLCWAAPSISTTPLFWDLSLVDSTLWYHYLRSCRKHFLLSNCGKFLHDSARIKAKNLHIQENPHNGTTPLKRENAYHPSDMQSRRTTLTALTSHWRECKTFEVLSNHIDWMRVYQLDPAKSALWLRVDRV
jgi:hypothetical protein